MYLQWIKLYIINFRIILLLACAKTLLYFFLKSWYNIFLFSLYTFILKRFIFVLDVNFGSKPGRAAGGSRGGGRGGAGGGRRREPNNAAAAANSRRPTPRGGRSGGGKQPLSRGYQSNHLRGTVAQEDEFQVGSVFNSGSKKQVHLKMTKEQAM